MALALREQMAPAGDEVPCGPADELVDAVLCADAALCVDRAGLLADRQTPSVLA